MKKITIIIAVLVLPVMIFGQGYNTAQTMKPGKLSAGSFLSISNGLSVLVKGNYGLKKGADMEMTLLMGSGSVFGLNMEKVVKSENKYIISGLAGAHIGLDGNFVGLDGTVNVTIPFKSSLAGYAGVDLDLNFVNSDISLPVSVFGGVEFGIRKNLTVLAELNIGINGASNMLGGGLNYYF